MRKESAISRGRERERMLLPARDADTRLLREECQLLWERCQLKLTLFPQVDHLPKSANAKRWIKCSPKRRVDLFPEKLFFCIRVQYNPFKGNPFVLEEIYPISDPAL